MKGLVKVLKIIWHGFEVFSTVVERFARALAVILLIAMSVMLLLNAASRWGIAPSSMMGWPLSIVGYMIAWSVLVMMGPVAKLDAHIKVPFLTSKLLGEKRGANFRAIMENLVGLGYSIFLTLPAYDWVSSTFREGTVEQLYGHWTYPLWVVRLGIFLGFTFLSFFYFERTVKWFINIASQKGGVSEPESGPPTTPMEANGSQTSLSFKEGHALEDSE
ncbi:TRAP transporter small permease [Chloroflexota bacterium]